MLELDPGERDNILILGQFKQHVAHRVVALDDVRQTVPGRIIQNIANYVRMNNSAELVVHKRAGIHRNEALRYATKVVRRQIRTVRQRGVDQGIDSGCRIGRDLNEGVQGQCEAVVEFVGQVLQEAGIIALCLGYRCHQRSAPVVTHGIRLYLHLI